MTSEQNELAPQTTARRRHLPAVALAAAAVLTVAAVVGVATKGDAKTPLAADPTATVPAELIGTWTPTSIDRLPTLGGARPDPPTISFSADRTWRGSDGCNGIGGTYRATSDGISVTSGAQTMIACNNVPNVEVLHASAHFRVSATELTLYDAGWRRLASYAKTR